MATGRVPTTANSPLTAKGDLFGYSTTQARVPVGNDGETIVADSSTSTGLRYNANYAAGKNKFINGDFKIWQRGTSFTTSASEAYTSDRWVQYSNGSMTTSQQTFTPGTAPVAGYEGTFFQRLTTSATNVNASLRQKIEDVRQFAGETVTLSYWVKGSGAFTATPMIRQNFGSGGSASVDTTNGTLSVTTSWSRVTKTFTVPSISGKTIGTGSCLEVFLYSFGDTIPVSGTIDIWGVQVEAGSVATAFQTATGTIQGELAACQRYFQILGGNVSAERLATIASTSSSTWSGGLYFPTQMRVAPTLTFAGTFTFRDDGNRTISSTNSGNISKNSAEIYGNGTGWSGTYTPATLLASNTSATISISAEL